MRLIKITFKDGTEREWQHEGRSGGSYSKRLKMEPGWVTVIDEYGTAESFPADTIKAVKTVD